MLNLVFISISPFHLLSSLLIDSTVSATGLRASTSLATRLSLQHYILDSRTIFRMFVLFHCTAHEYVNRTLLLVTRRLANLTHAWNDYQRLGRSKLRGNQNSRTSSHPHHLLQKNGNNSGQTAPTNPFFSQSLLPSLSHYQDDAQFRGEMIPTKSNLWLITKGTIQSISA